MKAGDSDFYGIEEFSYVFMLMVVVLELSCVASGNDRSGESGGIRDGGGK